MSAGAVIRPLRPDDVEAFRAVRLAVLADAPHAFGADHDEEAAQPLSFFSGRIEAAPPAVIFGAFVDGRLAGIARFSLEAGAKKRHIGWLTSVGVLPAFRGRGLARALVGAVVAHARGKAAVLRTAVAVGNDSARRVYAEAGFVSFGIEPRALWVDGRYLDEDMMSLDLDTPSR